jgi:hypothetical protein
MNIAVKIMMAWLKIVTILGFGFSDAIRVALTVVLYHE